MRAKFSEATSLNSPESVHTAAHVGPNRPLPWFCCRCSVTAATGDLVEASEGRSQRSLCGFFFSPQKCASVRAALNARGCLQLQCESPLRELQLKTASRIRHVPSFYSVKSAARNTLCACECACEAGLDMHCTLPSGSVSVYFEQQQKKVNFSHRVTYSSDSFSLSSFLLTTFQKRC